MKKLILSLERGDLPTTAGSKALALQRLKKIGVHIPTTHVCTWEAHQRYLANDPRLVDTLRGELERLVRPGTRYAVRSSANLEDSLEKSFAGQFKTVLHVQGVEDILMATWSVWASARTAAVHAYLQRHAIEDNELHMAVIIQEMVTPVFSGVALSRNPVTGGDELVVEAIPGEGTQLVQSGVTPERWVNKWGYWRENPAASRVPFEVIEQVVEETRKIAERLRHPVDMEWVFDGTEVVWVQMRPITALNHRNVYSHHIPREFLPGMIKPLVYSVNIPLVNSVWIRWIGEVAGDLGIEPEELTKSFYYRAYFNMGVLGSIFKSLGFPAESMEMLMGILPRGAARPRFKPSLKTFSRLPWLLVFLADKWTFGPRMRRALDRLEPMIRATPWRELDGRSPEELVEAIDRHFQLMKETAYYNVIGPLLMQAYNLILKSMLARRGIDINQYDLTEGMPELEEWAPPSHLARLNREFRSLPQGLQEKLRSLPFEELEALSEAGEFAGRVRAVVDQFGHLSNSGNDFSAVPWRETPSLVLRMVMEQEAPREEGGGKVCLSDLKKRHQAGLLLTLFHRRAREFRLLRERVSSAYTHGYGLFRYHYLALGRQFTRMGLLEAPEDIHYLTDRQVHAIALEGARPEGLREQVAEHKAEMKRFENIQLPTVIYGDELPPIRDDSANILTGVPASIGCHTGRVCVVRGVEDFPKVKPGDVLVIPYSEVSWTPLFARAGAVVAESGGLLSHSSIVAREYNIPAVVSVEGATRLPDGTLVMVDAHKGEVLILDPTDPPAEGKPERSEDAHP